MAPNITASSVVADEGQDREANDATDDDEECLLKPPIQRQSSLITMRPRKIVIEPLIILYVTATLPIINIRSEFILQKVSESMGIDLTNLSGNANESDSTCYINTSDPAYLARERVQSETSNWNMYISLAGLLPGFLSPIIYGALSDRLGRRFLLILPIIGTIISTIVYMSMIYFDLPIYFFFLTVIEYFMGGLSTMFLGVFAYIADTTTPKQRAFRMTVVDVVSLVNGGIANLFVGYWIKASGFFWPLGYVLGGNLLCLLYAIFCVPETVKPNQGGGGDTCKALMSGVRMIWVDDGHGRRWKLNMLLVCTGVPTMFHTMFLMTTYEMNSPLCWGSVLIGYFTAVGLAFKCLAMLVAAKLSFYLAEHWQIVLASISTALESFYLVIATTTIMMFFGPVLGCLSFLGLPMTRSILSKLVGKEEQASILSLYSATQHFAMSMSSILLYKIYGATLLFFEQTVFVLAGLVNLFGLGVILVYIYKTRYERREVEFTTKSIQS